MKVVENIEKAKQCANNFFMITQNTFLKIARHLLQGDIVYKQYSNINCM